MAYPQDELKSWRVDSQLSIEKAARVADVSNGTFQNWLKDGSRGPSIHCVLQLEAWHGGLVRRLFPRAFEECAEQAVADAEQCREL